MKNLRTAPALAATVAATALGLATPLAANAVTAHAAQAARPALVRGHTRVVSDCLHRRIEPHKIVTACADENTYLVGHYSEWLSKKAFGKGHLVVNDCTPDCASGTFRRYRATFRLYDVKQTAHGPMFSKIGVTYVKGGEQHDTILYPPTRPFRP